MKKTFPYKRLRKAMALANPMLICKCFDIVKKGTEKQIVYELRNGDIKGKNLINIAKKLLFDILDCKFLYKIYSISPRIENIQVDFSGVPSEKEVSNVTHFTTHKFDEYKHISEVGIETFYIDGQRIYDEQINNEFSYEIVGLNNFSPSMSINISYKYSDEFISGWDSLDNVYFECCAFGLKRQDSIPLWIEFIINSFSLYKSDNKVLAFFMVFAALDQYIETIRWRMAQEFKNILITNRKYILDKSMHDKYAEYLDIHRKLIDEKLLMFLRDGFPDEDNKYIAIYQSIQKFEKKRNQIAHCNDDYKYDDGDYEDLLFNFLRLQYLITYGQDIDCIFEIK